MKFSNNCVLCKLNISCAICQPTLRKNVIKEWEFFNRDEVFQLFLTSETVRWKLGLIKGGKKKIS